MTHRFLLSIIYVCVVANISANSPSNMSYTDPKFYHPFSKAPQQKTLSVMDEFKGQCYQNSLRNPRTDAFKCEANGQSFDPCFVRRYGNQNELLCANSPWESNATKITVNKPITLHQHADVDMSKDKPWALELVDGTRCKIVTTDDTSLADKGIQYVCNNKRYLLGNIQRCKGIWQIYLKDHETLTLAGIKRAWF